LLPDFLKLILIGKDLTVVVKNLTKIYGTQKAVDNISFEVTKGEIVGFLGPNGAGKSTTMKIISCYTFPSSGSVKINGYDILEHPLQVRSLIGYLPEQNPLYDDMYIREYLHFIARMHKMGKHATSKIEQLIELTGLVPECHKKTGMLSKGFRQRVGLAQSLIHDPEVLLLDEPTSGLDPNQVIGIRNLITEIGKTRTIILSSHIMQEVQAMCNRIIIINNGRLIADEKTELLLHKFQNKSRLRVEFKNPVTKAILGSIPGLDTIEEKDGKWIMTSSDPEFREHIFTFAVSINNPVLEIIPEGESLEKVFQQLTANS